MVGSRIWLGRAFFFFELKREGGGACKTFIFDAMVVHVTIKYPFPYSRRLDLKTNFVWVFRTRRQMDRVMSIFLDGKHHKGHGHLGR